MQSQLLGSLTHECLLICGAEDCNDAVRFSLVRLVSSNAGTDKKSGQDEESDTART